MSGWTVALILYVIPLLGGIEKFRKEDPLSVILATIFWPPMMLIGTMMLYFKRTKP